MGAEDLDLLLNFLMPFGRKMLEKYGEVYPCAVGMKQDGELVPLNSETGRSEPTVQEVMEVLLVGLTRGAREETYRATGMCLDVRVTLPETQVKSDAICASLESSDGRAIDIFLPYRSTTPGVFEYGEMFAAEAPRRIFPESPPEQK
ncbi:MAG: hypothetical protein HYY93_15520 [Planctomycetes bacterium]|nr:hypothetical protein [Planctomycetota bacterium]